MTANALVADNGQLQNIFFGENKRAGQAKNIDLDIGSCAIDSWAA